MPRTRPRLGGLPHLDMFTWQIVTPVLNVLTSVNLPEVTQTMYESSEFGYEGTEYERSMGTTALEKNNPFLVITQTYFNSIHLIVFCVAKVFMVLFKMETA